MEIDIKSIKTLDDLKIVMEYYGCNFKLSNGQYKSNCIFHQEKTASLYLSVKNGQAFYKCFGCNQQGDIINVIQIKEGLSTIEATKRAYEILGKQCSLKPSKIDKLINYIETNKFYKLDGFRIEKVYVYMLDEDKPSFLKIKYRNLTDKSIKDLRTYKVIDAGEYYKTATKAKGGEYEHTIYNYPKVKKAIEKGNKIYFVEGEKDADNLQKLGLTATTIYTKTWKEIYSKQLEGAKIVFIGDTGEAGEQFKKLIYKNLKRIVSSFKVVDLEGLSDLGDNKDVSDWLEVEGNDKAKLIRCIEDGHDLLKDEIYKYLDERPTKDGVVYTPRKIWNNLECLLKYKHITVRYNELSKEVDIEGIEIENSLGKNSQLYDIHSLCHNNRLKLNINDVQNFIERIGRKNSYNPVKVYLEDCLKNWDGKSRIKDLCNTLITPYWFNDEHKEVFITKWLLNTVNIPFNDGTYGAEGILVIQGYQGAGKTRWIKSIIPNTLWLKTGLEIDPSDRDKVKQATKYWVAELGEMDATLKRDQAKLKAFFTEAKDEYRLPYARVEESYPRLTSFYATVNDEEFLKDPTGNRRYWVIPVDKVIVNHNIDLNQLWGEVMHLLRVEKAPHYLTSEDLEILNANNRNFEVKDEVYIKVSEGFQWDLEEGYWFNMKATEIADYLNIRNMNSLANTLKKFNVEKKRLKTGVYYTVPPFKKKNEEDLTSPFVKKVGKYNNFRAI